MEASIRSLGILVGAFIGVFVVYLFSQIGSILNLFDKSLSLEAAMGGIVLTFILTTLIMRLYRGK